MKNGSQLLYLKKLECEGAFLQDSILFLMGPNSVSGKTVYKSCVKSFSKNFLHNRVDTPWRAVLHLGVNVKPEWRALYKSPLSKKVGDVQWRILHGAIAVNALVSVINQVAMMNVLLFPEGGCVILFCFVVGLIHCFKFKRIYLIVLMRLFHWKCLFVVLNTLGNIDSVASC